ncbi:hypothetical protein AGDE_14593 [Angomonas deanei]|uniref:Uncharacterized protein n=1 Tax=Angomonas deanei TaxID=59799 RepID=A0A7G2CSB5_9TRYP|nr:hypothetical protein AGDE_14593 [Angomonas deanei]CAD2222067.1 hypothetical protein, conserved [Angomonas deanei]|eukprot:EPY20573.1 hypothetical protein AGDE_14593 [Angomonas deanei]
MAGTLHRGGADNLGNPVGSGVCGLHVLLPRHEVHLVLTVVHRQPVAPLAEGDATDAAAEVQLIRRLAGGEGGVGPQGAHPHIVQVHERCIGGGRNRVWEAGVMGERVDRPHKPWQRRASEGWGIGLAARVYPNNMAVPAGDIGGLRPRRTGDNITRHGGLFTFIKVLPGFGVQHDHHAIQGTGENMFPVKRGEAGVKNIGPVLRVVIPQQLKTSRVVHTHLQVIRSRYEQFPRCIQVDAIDTAPMRGECLTNRKGGHHRGIVRQSS